MKVSDEVVEVAAKKAAAANGTCLVSAEDFWKMIGPGDHENWHMVARAALEAALPMVVGEVRALIIKWRSMEYSTPDSRDCANDLESILTNLASSDVPKELKED